MTTLPTPEDLAQLPLNFEGQVAEKHLDFLGHMNVMWYTHFFDRATWNWYNKFGFGHDYHQPPNGSFAVEQYTRYLAELRVGDEFKIYSRALVRNDKLFHFMHFMLRVRDERISAIHELLGIHINLTDRRSSPLPDHITAQWDALIAQHTALDWPPPISGVISLNKKP
ncbi:MAG: thioesterase [Chloroflexi bacterium]|nr:thioesterase family protein [Chloroflexota bacterium]MQC25931.1 thioesterase [Chloroflexota bacterium]